MSCFISSTPMFACVCGILDSFLEVEVGRTVKLCIYEWLRSVPKFTACGYSQRYFQDVGLGHGGSLPFSLTLDPFCMISV
jgi:hypothetical protein